NVLGGNLGDFGEFCKGLLIPNLRPNPANRLPENPSAGRKRLDGGFAFRRNRFSGSLIGCNF
ncbi:hypothetical protein, partial [Eikenella corrodens]|uniref:hypothetical protein n=1 Tax=Eikenella corrodens TaxID=539 RepID=UPI00241E1AC0